MTVTTINVQDMHCAACTNKIRNALDKLADVDNLQFNPVRRQVFVTHGEAVNSAALLERIEEAGFRPHLENDSRLERSEHDNLLRRLGIAGLAMMQVMMVQIALYAGVFQGMEEPTRRLLEFTALLFCIPVVSYSATGFFKNALRGLSRGLNMDAPIALAIAVAFSVSLVNTLRGYGEVYYDSVVMFTFLMLGARYLEQRLRLRLGVEDSLLASLPRSATVITSNGRERRALEDIELGAALWIAQGERVPLDGVLDSPDALLDEAMLTGESDWRAHERGDRLFAGTVNRGAGFTLRVTAKPAQTRIAEIDALASTALSAKHRLARTADRVARVFIPAILLIAALTYALWSMFAPAQALSAALAVLVVSCPCALSLATPAALTAALTRLRRAGILVKTARALETAEDIGAVYFDKTGTLTSPRPHVTETHTLGGFTSRECWRFACAVQAHSSHPLARAFADPTVVPAADVKLADGSGLTGMVDGHRIDIGTADFCRMTAEAESCNKAVYMAVDREPAAVFLLANQLRADACDTVNALRNLGLEVGMLSGDNAANCLAVAAQLGMSFAPGSTPEGKPALLRSPGPVMYVGDGINDLPALAAADVAVATLETTDIVKARADVLLLTRRLRALCDFLRVGRRGGRVMRQNLGWALGYNLIAIPLAAFGYAPPWAAALGMSLSSLIVMLNASRLLNTQLET